MRHRGGGGVGVGCVCVGRGDVIKTRLFDCVIIDITCGGGMGGWGAPDQHCHHVRDY